LIGFPLSIPNDTMEVVVINVYGLDPSVSTGKLYKNTRMLLKTYQDTLFLNNRVTWI
jgi:hypothetical protein